MQTRNKVQITLGAAVGLLLILGCGLGPLLGSAPTPTTLPAATSVPTLATVPTLTSVPLPTVLPGIGVSLQAFQSAFEQAGFTFKAYESERIQGDYTSADFQTWVMLVLNGQPEDLSSATLMVLNGTDANKVIEILNLFFKTAFPVQADQGQAMEWFANKSGVKTGQDKGETTVGSINLSWAKDSVAGYAVTVASSVASSGGSAANPGAGAADATPTNTASSGSKNSGSGSGSNATILFQDDFSSNAKGWVVGPMSDEYCDWTRDIVNGKYRWTLTAKKDYCYQLTDVPNFTGRDLLFSIEATVVDTTATPGALYFGFTIREPTGNSNRYEFGFKNDGSYMVTLWPSDSSQSSKDILTGTLDTAILQKGLTTTFAVQALGSTFTIFVNGKQINTVTDANVNDTGIINVWLGVNKAGESVTIDFDNIKIQQAP